MVVRMRRDLRSRGGRVQLYPVFSILALCAVGGGWRSPLRRARLPVPGVRTVDRRRRPPAVARVRRLWQSDRRPRTWRRRDVLTTGSDRTGRGRPDPRLRLRPRRSRRERDRRQPPGRRADSHRSPHLAAPRRRHRAVRAGGALLRRSVRPHLRRALPRRGCGPGPLDSTASREPAESVIPFRRQQLRRRPGRIATASPPWRPRRARPPVRRPRGGSLPARYEDQLAYDIAQADTASQHRRRVPRGGAAARRPRPCATSATSPSSSSPPARTPSPE